MIPRTARTRARRRTDRDDGTSIENLDVSGAGPLRRPRRFDNVTDYGANYGYVRHVLSMDTTPPGNPLMYRAITAPVAWTTAYDCIIVVEGILAGLFLTATAALWKARDASAALFQHAKRWVQAAVTTAFLLWFLGFMVVGGEWFAMWQSKSWNGQEATFRFVMILLAVLIYVNQPDAELPDRP